MSFLSDLRILYHMVAKPVRGRDHEARLESFYSGQAAGYDDFRRRLLQGREAMYRSIPVPDGGVWVDLGGGTGANLEPIGGELHRASKVYLVDLCDSLLSVARNRCEARGWKNVEAVHADATLFRPAEGCADVVTFSYSLTMIPDWYAAIDNALAMLWPGGTIGVTDFFVARKFPAEGRARHGWFDPRRSGPCGSPRTTYSSRPITSPICSGGSRRCAWRSTGRSCPTCRWSARPIIRLSGKSRPERCRRAIGMIGWIGGGLPCRLK